MLRLIHTTNLTFEEFEKLSAPSYAIVSHRWGHDEVSHQDFLDGKKREGYGWTKIVKACEIARAQDLTWLWIDTCCIDKKSSAELTESINSMYRWYYHSHDCLTLLPDIDLTDEDPGFSEQFRQSSWFTRGWTLQELLAPRRLLFFNENFQHVGDKYHRLQDIVAATGIDKYYLLGMSNVQEASVAERMQWASLRESTRTEDAAYCLLGLFDVNMPLLYGEGAKAFLRLQLEIIRKTDDESIFAWWQDPVQSGSWQGLLAPSPRAFAVPKTESVKVLKVQSRQPYSMTHKGLRLKISRHNTTAAQL
ncbi:hypothetical protein M409DRAFT_62958 [Zasmidium cellare ATCC 36951]|uniref:Uncharacterized protein n=1 Tax=Zasmidium cellare ATCC 36951 TaxID=1080233 RepID=A0A6A6D276_ZASCE|nr:uncharacterized protein M409DRAFT_62958 [Zasmidium cellare ATCC 36951]KAF2172199.1 hypothetical protein M409DRAFT_62958 [Zasmidium cellare ATCC 36951]